MLRHSALLRPVFLFLLGTLCVVLGPARAHADEVPRYPVPEARPIQLDGQPMPAEWEAARSLELERGTHLRLQQYRGTLMLAFASDRRWTEGSALTIFFCPNGPKAGGRGPGCVRIDYEPLRHNRPHLVIERHDARGLPARVYEKAVARQNNGDHGTQIEMAMPLSLLGLTTTDRPPLRVCLLWGRRGARAMTYPAGLDFRGKQGQAPVDFVSAGRWALLDGWGDASGPGAFPAAEWKAWFKHDAEIHTRGKAAHNAINLLVEEWKKTAKQDDEQVPEVVGNLAWIRRHEALTSEDLMAIATLYRYLNRHDEAVGILSTLEGMAQRGALQQRALHQRALAYRSSERYDLEVADWLRLGELLGARGAPYTQEAAKARAQKEAWEKEQAARRAVEADAANPRVRFDTVHGPVEVVLHAKAAPAAVAHFLKLVDAKTYDDTQFHRVQGDFMAQGGDPKTRPGGSRSDLEIPMELNKGHDFFRGALAFARQPHKEVNQSQFFIMTSPKPGFGRYTIFGHVRTGMAAVDRMATYDKLTRVVRLGK